LPQTIGEQRKMLRPLLAIFVVDTSDTKIVIPDK
jgi:hypothetical protein